MTRVVVLQSNYIPWRGYFDLVNDCDLFVFYDDVQYTKNDWRNRNRIKTAAGPVWLTVPVGSNLNRLVQEVQITDRSWQKKHLRTLEQSYARAGFFSEYIDFFRGIYDQQWESLSELNQTIIQRISSEILGCRTGFAKSCDFETQGSGSDRLLQLLLKVGATEYISGPSARQYLNEAEFKAAGISVIWKDYAGYPDYPQLHGSFNSQVSIVDLILNTGPSAADFIWNWRSRS